jgi:hypothetical protein
LLKLFFGVSLFSVRPGPLALCVNSFSALSPVDC